eukprot:scaffold109_cov252-Pinguiococcus_pyrenoidosus.AAC.27
MAATDESTSSTSSSPSCFSRISSWLDVMKLDDAVLHEPGPDIVDFCLVMEDSEWRSEAADGSRRPPGSWRQSAKAFLLHWAAPRLEWSRKPTIHRASTSAAAADISLPEERSRDGYATSSYGMYFEHSGSRLRVYVRKISSGAGRRSFFSRRRRESRGSAVPSIIWNETLHSYEGRHIGSPVKATTSSKNRTVPGLEGGKKMRHGRKAPESPRALCEAGLNKHSGFVAVRFYSESKI